MPLNGLLHLKYAQHVSGTSMPIIRSSRLYVCYYRLRCAVLSCWLSGVRSRAVGAASRKRDVAHILSAINHSVVSSCFFFSTHMQRCTDKHTSSLPRTPLLTLNPSLNQFSTYFIFVVPLPKIRDVMSIEVSVFSIHVFEVQTSDPDLCQPNAANSHSWWPPALRRPDPGTEF